MAKKILILGAGYAGIEAALTLHKKKKKTDDIEIHIINRKSYQTHFARIHEVVGNRVDADSVKVPLHDIFQHTDVKVILDEIESIDFENNKLASKSVEYPYDYLIIASGGSQNDLGVPNVKENTFSLWSVEEAVKLRNHIANCFLKAIMEKDVRARESLLTFVVAGGGITGTEVIGEIAIWIGQLCKDYSISRKDVRLILVEALPNILDDLLQANIDRSVKYLTHKLKVEIRTSSEIIEVKPGAAVLKSGENIETQTVIWTTGIKGSKLAEKLDIEKGNNSRIKIDGFANTSYNNVFAIGNAAAFINRTCVMPTMVKYAVEGAKTAAANILSLIRSDSKKKVMHPHLYGIAVSIGSYFAVGNFIGLRLPPLLAVLIKHFIAIKYLFHIGGFESAIKYLKDEILDRKPDKFLLEKHLTAPAHALFMVPIRIFLGYSWLMEGLAKISEGWLNKPMLAGSLVDGASSASTTETGEKVFRIVAGHTPGWYAWIADNIVVPNAQIFQPLIVITEIGIGLALISGTFTFLFALIALGMNINFLLSTGLLPATWWYIPAAVCLLGGAGRSFSVDHYLMPYLMRQWRYFIRNKRIKLWLWR